MNYTKAKEKLHSYIDQAGEDKIIELLSFLETSGTGDDVFYGDATLNVLRERSAEYKSGSSPTYTLEESMERINSQRWAAYP